MAAAYAWIVPDSWLPLMQAQGGVAPCYAVPVSVLQTWEGLPGATLYIVARSKAGDCLFARVVVESVDVAVDDNDEPSEYLLNTNLARSLRVSRVGNQDDARDFSIKAFENDGFGFTTADADDVATAEQLIRNGIKFLFTHVPEKTLAKIDPPVQKCGSAFAPMVVLKEVVSRFALSEMWGSVKFPHPIANFVAHYISGNPEFLSSGTVEDSLEVLKGYAWLRPAGGENNATLETPQASALQAVDITLTPINPSEVKVRHFAAHVQSVSVETVMRKTESAERRHQQMLRDIAEHFIKEGITPYQSESIDLAVKHGEKTSIFELKSITPTNIVQQISKGFFQLLYYSHVLQDCGAGVNEMNLVIEAGCPDAVIRMMGAIVARAGATLLVYDAEKEWPSRLWIVGSAKSDIRKPFDIR